jgi:hypothetical protein
VFGLETPRERVLILLAKLIMRKTLGAARM